jgi:N-acetyl-1-D-myo-inositol-2-amino-2-deoxy-alpha-D-glucopyranoside deacetylase
VAEDVLRRAYADLPAASAVQAVLRRDDRLTLPRPDGPVPSVAVAPGEVAVTVAATGVLARVAAALGEHRTQVASIALVVPGTDDAMVAGADPAHPDPSHDDVHEAGPDDVVPRLAGCYALSNHVLAPLLTHESYRFAPGYPRRAVVWPAGVRPVR